MNFDSLTFSEENFQIIKNELLSLRKENGELKKCLAKMEIKCSAEMNNLDNDVVASSIPIHEVHGLKELLTQSENEILKAGNEIFLKDNLIEEKEEEIESLQKEVERLKKELELLKAPSQEHISQEKKKKSKIEEFLNSKEVLSLPHEQLKFTDDDEHKEEEKGTKKRKLLRKNRIEVDLDEFNSTETSDEFINI